MKKQFILLFGLFVGILSLHAQEFAVKNTQAPEKTPFAKPVAVRYELTRPTGYDVQVDEKSFSPDFEITQAAFSPQTGVYDFTAIPFTLGKSTFTATFILTQNGQPTEHKTEVQTPIEITPVQVFNDKKFREIRAPFVPSGWGVWLVILLILAALIYLWHLYKQRRAQQPLAVHQQEDHRPCDEIALSKIDALLNSGLWERKAYKLFYITLGDIFREYMWRQFGTDTSADTTVELLRRVKKIPAMQPLLTDLKDFLNSGDLVKFAKAEPSETARNKDVQILREIVRETSPKETTVPEKPL